MPKAAHPDSNLTAVLDEALERSAKISLTNLKCPVWVTLDIFDRGDPSIHVRYTSNSDQGDEAQRNVAMCQKQL
jgi:hypothetical protein